MTIGCKLCGTLFKSVILDKTTSFKAISEQMLSHFQRKHPENVKEFVKRIGIVQVALAQYISILEFAVIPEGEDWIMNEQERCKEIVMAGMGYRPVGDEVEPKDEDAPEEKDDEVPSGADIDKVFANDTDK